ncbi:RNA polymerase sigma-70 factor (ECF subfamily) [Labedaea rhizosphaerae]|uniref:RNA polymerase sigma-70 factor (ECF subfamily) n=1 Tax=Labedaea rhizosphaerae TaxID=598644 RepID=A0A4R6S691_LABRH|nr:RNA polymerase sigma-70 factor (ECF subfamily) [Labedaea rhizosphaerae]
MTVVSAIASSSLLCDRRPVSSKRDGAPEQAVAIVSIVSRRSHRAGRAPGEEQLRALYQEHGRSLLAYAMRLTGDRAAAEDVVQETLLRAWKHRDELSSGKGSVRGWLLTVTRNIVTDRARARAARPAEVDQKIDVPSTDLDPADKVADSITVLGALERLSPDHRAVLVELYYRGHSVAETAALLGIAPGTVKSRAYYAVRALRSDLVQTEEVRR